VTSLSVMSPLMVAGAVAMALPVPACHAGRTITVMLCGGAGSARLTIPVQGAPVTPTVPEFAKACHACRHEDETPEPA
jgi:hypothetical protein